MPEKLAKLLLVDDTEANLWALSAVLRRDDVELLLARSGTEALELLLTHEVALALIDVQMPCMDGFELAELMRGVERTRYVPIIFLTASLQDHACRFRGYEAGAVDFLYKPVEPEILKSKARIFLDLDRQRHELARHRDQLTALVEEKSRLIEDQDKAEAALRASEERLRSFSHELELRVQERTQDLLRSQERLRSLATELNLAEQRERQRLATELHDYLAQLLVLSKLKIGQGKRLAEQVPQCAELIHQTDEVLSEALSYTRTLVADLSPPVLREFGLAAGLKWLAERMRRHELRVTVELEGNELPALPEDQAVLLFQSVRELLINVSKHAGCREASVRLEQSHDTVCIEVRDAGVGFDVSAAAAAAGSAVSKFGLFSIRERMKALGGSFELESTPGSGSRAVLVLPVAAERPPSPLLSEPLDDYQSPRRPEFDPEPSLHQQTLQKQAMRVLLVDDHAMVRQGLRSMLDGYSDVVVVGEAWDGQCALDCIPQLRPSVVVMDVNMPRMNGIEATAVIKARYPDIVVIGLSVNADRDNQAAMTQAGAAMLLTKEAAVEQLYLAIQATMQKSGSGQLSL